MYRTKRLHTKLQSDAEKAYATKHNKSVKQISDPYKKEIKKDSRHMQVGKSFEIQIPKKGQTTGYFATLGHPKDPKINQMKEEYFKYTNDAYNDRPKFSDAKNKPPIHEGTLAFGSKDAMKRGEFSNHFRSRQWRETLTKETRFNEKFAEIARERAIARGDTLDTLVAASPQTRKEKSIQENEWRKSRGLPTCFQTEVPDHLYDIGKETEGGTTPICNKCSRDTFYCKHRVGTGVATARRPGGTAYQTSAREVGGRVWGVSTKPSYGRTNTTKQFFDISHIG